MYVLWARGKDELEFENDELPLPEPSKHDWGMHMVQLLRADKIQIPEK